MPQAMPMNWLILYIFLITLFLILNIKLFYSFSKIPNSKLKNFNKKNYWKW
uniref:ATP synthase complex subunit 8 n=1 Tax=Harmonia quadripunctata TaxID=346781 RepID=A0A343C300_HARQU|nr:ATP synthase F0 subunit 8 [Harmonia quadripunctata]